MPDPVPTSARALSMSDAELMALGLAPKHLRRLKMIREEFQESGLTPEEFSRCIQERLEKAQEAVHQNKIGWSRPILAGAAGTWAVWALWETAHGEGSWPALLALLGTFAGVVTGFDSDDLPSQRRVIGGAAIGAAIAVLLLVAVQMA